MCDSGLFFVATTTGVILQNNTKAINKEAQMPMAFELLCL
jgi:hypothetical protein